MCIRVLCWCCLFEGVTMNYSGFLQDLESERRKLVVVQRQLREVEGSSSAAAVQAGETAAMRETIAALKNDLKVLRSI